MHRLAPPRLASPQDVEHFVRAFGVRIVAGKIFTDQADLVVHLILEKVSEFGFAAIGIDLTPIVLGIDISGSDRCVLLVAELVGAFDRVKPMFRRRAGDLAADGVDIGVVAVGSKLL